LENKNIENILNNKEEILNNLSPEEKSLALSILKEMNEKGSSELLNKLTYDDYKEIPVDIETFIDNNNYLGYAWKDQEGKSKMFPYWRKRLKELFPDNIHTSFNNAIFTGARGLGKSEIAILIGLYLMHRIICLKNPLEHFHLKPTEQIAFAFMNIKLALAENIGISKFQNTVKLSPWFLEKGTMVGRTNKLWEPPKYINIIIGSQASDVIGQPIFYAFFDEIDFIKNQSIDIQKAKAKEMMNTAIGGMKTRFLYKGKADTILILASSKRSDKSFLEEHTKKQLEIEGENIFIVDEAVWNVQPPEKFSGERFNVAVGDKYKVSKIIQPNEDIDEYRVKGYMVISVPVEYRVDFKKDIEASLCDFAGISSSALSKFISGGAVKEVINYNLINPFSKDIIEVGTADEDQYYDFIDLNKITPEVKSKPLYIHMDMSVSGDMTGIAGVIIKGKKPSIDALNQSKDLFYSLVFSVSIKAPRGHQISFEKNRNFIYWLKDKGFNIKGITTDSFQAYDTGQALLAKGYPYSQLSVDRVDPQSHVCVPYQYFKNTIYEKRIEMFNSVALIEEITNLERNIGTGKIDHPTGFRKDVSDAVCGAVFNASKNAEQYAYDYGENLEMFSETNSPDAETQLVVDFESELLKMNNPFKGLPPPQSSNGFKKNQLEDDDVPYIDGDILMW